MANGIIARQRDAAALAVSATAQNAPCYIGQAPIWQKDDANWKNLAGKTILAKSISDVREQLGYAKPASGAWPKEFSLCMAAFYHTNVEKILPIILINNSAAITESENTTETAITFINGVAKIASPYVVLNTLSIVVGSGGSTETKTKGTDYTAIYDEDGQNVIITALTSMTAATASYKTVDPAALAFSKDTYDEVDYIGQNTGFIPTTLAAPLWDNVTDSASSKVMNKIAEICEGVVDKHWYCEAFGNLSSATRSGALTEKENISSAKMKVCWPYAKVGSYIYPVSLIFSARRQSIDTGNDGVPYESASNEFIDITNLCDNAGNLIKQLELEADSLNEHGIATMAFTTAMQWRTWGVCMANYSEAGRGSIPPNKLNDVAVQMMDYICNDFEKRYGDMVHKPMSMRAVNDILSSFSYILNGLISDGMLIAGKIAFEPSENNTANLADGQFTYSIEETNTPPAKAIIGNVTYDSDALDTYFSEIGGEE
ncbi:MAG: hypothetical protein J6Y90_04965 [Lachnospiraceae bacterium]|nr:hypothetical protein [Lachnospiraceae bacterium]